MKQALDAAVTARRHPVLNHQAPEHPIINFMENCEAFDRNGPDSVVAAYRHAR
jgi:hypothetical protein